MQIVPVEFITNAGRTTIVISKDGKQYPFEVSLSGYNQNDDVGELVEVLNITHKSIARSFIIDVERSIVIDERCGIACSFIIAVQLVVSIPSRSFGSFSTLLPFHVPNPPKLPGLSINFARVGGVEIPNNKRVEFSLQYIHGIGRTSARKIPCDLNMDNKSSSLFVTKSSSI
ncbi:hypothetical protein CRG98_041175 [Punica granatum]|uniref:Uncharacterized protein n=1 Tax=Punica granatum TaxID=22663 RepID=A0A2I0I4W8_PUNGR|nr:hypothetical protein CRG98_041175 [Punica granatum]